MNLKLSILLISLFWSKAYGLDAWNFVGKNQNSQECQVRIQEISHQVRNDLASSNVDFINAQYKFLLQVLVDQKQYSLVIENAFDASENAFNKFLFKGIDRNYISLGQKTTLKAVTHFDPMFLKMDRVYLNVDAVEILGFRSKAIKEECSAFVRK